MHQIYIPRAYLVSADSINVHRDRHKMQCETLLKQSFVEIKKKIESGGNEKKSVSLRGTGVVT